jgi:beta-glucosidase
VYFEPADPAQPVRLAGWRVVPATPGRRVTVEVPTDPRSLRRWDTAYNGWVDVGPGRLLVARGLGDIRATVPLTTG